MIIEILRKHVIPVCMYGSPIKAFGDDTQPVIPAKAGIQKYHQHGFTLIEILIVITIIAILATTIIPNFIGFDVEARISATQTNLNSIRTR
ncbi:MAG: prepilin-type N-terminal cleavage/methylation domain-containing protein, partial [Candidatus Omnitrophota bacterium]|nr:prepilin-type N-terminal cleavage/methylation domain-containing protein [Candidatus Omnitrophota bacterium]